MQRPEKKEVFFVENEKKNKLRLYLKSGNIIMDLVALVLENGWSEEFEYE